MNREAFSPAGLPGGVKVFQIEYNQGGGEGKDRLTPVTERYTRLTGGAITSKTDLRFGIIGKFHSTFAIVEKIRTGVERGSSVAGSQRLDRPGGHFHFRADGVKYHIFTAACPPRRVSRF